MGSSPSPPGPTGPQLAWIERTPFYTSVFPVRDRDQRSSRLSTTLSSEVKEEAFTFRADKEVNSPVMQRGRRSVAETLWCLCQLVCGALAFTADARAQLYSGSLTGIVTDPSGAAVPGAMVKLVDVGKEPVFSPWLCVSVANEAFFATETPRHRESEWDFSQLLRQA